MRTLFSSLVVAALAAGVLGCGTDAPQVDSAAEAQERAPIKRPSVGTYRDAAPAIGGIQLLVLKSNGRYHSQKFAGRAKPRMEDGTYNIATQNGIVLIHALNLTPKGGKMVSYDFAVNGNLLELSQKGAVKAHLLLTEPQWCAINLDCKLQGLVSPEGGEMACKSNACVISDIRVDPCSDNSKVECNPARPLICLNEKVSTIRNGCFVCVNPITCE
jgi:hypothetical protein